MRQLKQLLELWRTCIARFRRTFSDQFFALRRNRHPIPFQNYKVFKVTCTRCRPAEVMVNLVHMSV